MAECIRQLCALSILCGAALSITPEGSVKRVMGIVCSAALICAAARPLMGLDFSAYALELARYEKREAALLERGEDLNDRLNRLVIEDSYEAYIMDKAEELGLGAVSARVTVQWNKDGLWVPYSAELSGPQSEGQRERLCGLIEAELGIPAERQQWSDDE